MKFRVQVFLSECPNLGTEDVLRLRSKLVGSIQFTVMFVIDSAALATRRQFRDLRIGQTVLSGYTSLDVEDLSDI